MASTTSTQLHATAGNGVVSVGTPPVGGQRFYWAMEFGEARIITSGGTTIAFPNSGFSGKPFVQLTASRKTAGSGDWAIAILDNLTPTSATIVAIDDTGAGLSNCSVFWQSIGTRTF